MYLPSIRKLLRHHFRRSETSETSARAQSRYTPSAHSGPSHRTVLKNISGCQFLRSKLAGTLH